MACRTGILGYTVPSLCLPHRLKFSLSLKRPEPEFFTFKEPKNRFYGTNSPSMCSLAGRYDNRLASSYSVQSPHRLFKGTKAWDNFDFFLPKSNPYMPFVNFCKKISLLILRFSPKYRRSNISAVTEHTRNQIFFWEVSKNFFSKIFTLVLLDRFLDGFSKFWFFIGKICILIRDFWVIFENYSMRMLSIRGNNFIACWAYTELISSHAEHTRNEFPRMLSQQ